MISLTVNGSELTADVDEDMPLLWVLRDELGLVGTKYSCGRGICGACTVLVDGTAVRACVLRVGDLRGAVTTIEGLGQPEATHIVQAAWIEHQVAQCGYCQPGQILAAVAFLASNPNPTDEDIDRGMSSCLCRCGTYPRIRAAIKTAARRLEQAGVDRGAEG